MSLRDEVAGQTRIDELQRSLDRVSRELVRVKRQKDELTDAVYRAALDGFSALRLDPVKPPRSDDRANGEEVAVQMFSDLQLAKVTPTYNTDVCEQRIELLGDKTERLVNIQRSDHPVRKLRVWMLGDIIEGELIFPGQSHLIDSSLYRQVTVDGPRICANYLRRMLSIFEEVEVICVIGNHGRVGGRASRDYNPETNADRMLYRILQMMFEHEPRINFVIPAEKNERSWYAVDRIGNYSCLLFHGDQVRGGFGGFPWYGFGKKVQGWANGAIPEHFDDAACGHWHQAARFPLNFITVRVNGSTESDNTYAQEQLAAAGRPSQWLLFVHPERGRVTAEYCVYLDEEAV